MEQLKQAFDQLIKMMFSLVEKVGPLDGYLVAPHGATVSEQYPDADGYWLSKLRKKLVSINPSLAPSTFVPISQNVWIESTNALIGLQKQSSSGSESKRYRSGRIDC